LLALLQLSGGSLRRLKEQISLNLRRLSPTRKVSVKVAGADHETGMPQAAKFQTFKLCRNGGYKNRDKSAANPFVSL